MEFLVPIFWVYWWHYGYLCIPWPPPPPPTGLWGKTRMRCTGSALIPLILSGSSTYEQLIRYLHNAYVDMYMLNNIMTINVHIIMFVDNIKVWHERLCFVHCFFMEEFSWQMRQATIMIRSRSKSRSIWFNVYTAMGRLVK